MKRITRMEDRVAMMLEELTRQIIGAAMEVHRSMGMGFVESIYRNAMFLELNARGLSLQNEYEVRVMYKDQPVGRHRLDLLVDKQVIVELKAVSAIADVHVAQTLSYLRATNLDVALIINFGSPRLTWKRLVKTRK